MRNKIAAAVGVALVASGGVAYGGTTSSSYSTTVGRFNGKGYTEYQSKAYTDREGGLYAASVGGSYKLDARMSENGTWISGVDDATAYRLPNTNPAGLLVRTIFNNGVLTPTNVQVSGTWKSN